MKLKGRIHNITLPRGSQWQDFEFELPETILMEKLRVLLLEIGWKLGIGLPKK
jgi:hypothetical protein